MYKNKDKANVILPQNLVGRLESTEAYSDSAQRIVKVLGTSNWATSESSDVHRGFNLEFVVTT